MKNRRDNFVIYFTILHLLFHVVILRIGLTAIKLIYLQLRDINTSKH